MRNEILRDMVFGCAGVLMVLAVIGLPQPAAAPQMWQMQFQRDRLLPYYSPNRPHPRLSVVGTERPAVPTP